MKQKTNSTLALAATSFALIAGSKAVQLFPAGQFSAPEGSLAGEGPWNLNKKQAKQLMAALSDQPDMLIDYDHQSLLFTENKQPLAAAGMFSGAQLRWREGKGLFAESVQWTKTAAAKIKAKQYRYISPLFTYDSRTGAVQQLISIALTDNPAIKNMQAIELAAASLFLPHHKEETMNPELLKLLGLADDADDAAVLAACTTLKAAGDKNAELLAQIETLKADKDALAATSAKADPDKYVPVAVVAELQTQLAALSAAQEADKLTRLIDANAAKLPTPGLKKWAATQSLAALTAYLQTAPEIAALSAMQTEGNQPPDAVSGSDGIIAAASQYRHEQQQLGNEISVADAVSHVTQAGAK